MEWIEGEERHAEMGSHHHMKTRFALFLGFSDSLTPHFSSSSSLRSSFIHPFIRWTILWNGTLIEAPGMKCHQRSQLLGDDGSHHQCMPSSLPHLQNEGAGGANGSGAGSSTEGAYNAINYSNYSATSTFGTTALNGNGRTTGRPTSGFMHSKTPPHPTPADESYQTQMIMKYVLILALLGKWDNRNNFLFPKSIVGVAIPCQCNILWIFVQEIWS